MLSPFLSSLLLVSINFCLHPYIIFHESLGLKAVIRQRPNSGSLNRCPALRYLVSSERSISLDSVVSRLLLFKREGQTPATGTEFGRTGWPLFVISIPPKRNDEKVDVGPLAVHGLYRRSPM